MEKTDGVMKRALLLYREDRDLENLVDFLQKKVREGRNGRGDCCDLPSQVT